MELQRVTGPDRPSPAGVGAGGETRGGLPAGRPHRTDVPGEYPVPPVSSEDRGAPVGLLGGPGAGYRKPNSGTTGPSGGSNDSMTRFHSIWIALAAVLLVSAPPLRAQGAESILARADRALDGIASLRADFVQRSDNPILERAHIGHGTLHYRAPDRFRIDYRYPIGDVVVNDGTHVWIYLPSSQPGQVIRQRVEESGVRNPLTYLRDLRSGYDVRVVGEETLSGSVTDRLALSPRSAAAEFVSMDVWVERATGLPRQVRTESGDGVVKTYTFVKYDRGARSPDSVFAFDPPRGVEIY